MKILKESYTLLFDKSVLDATSEKELESINDKTLEKLYSIFPNADKPVKLLINGKESVSSIEDILQEVPMKEGIDIVKFSSGNYGFVAYSGMKSTEIEVLS